MINIEVDGNKGRIKLKGNDVFEHVADLMAAAECSILEASRLLNAQKKAGVEEETVFEDVEKLIAVMLGNLMAGGVIREDSTLSMMVEAIAHRERQTGNSPDGVNRAVQYVKDILINLGNALR